MPSLPEQSLPMKLLRRLGRDDLAWTLRRLHVPVSKDALVLEVGSGGNPFPRSNVLLDAYEHTRERNYQPLITDRPIVLGLIENLPFRDDAFDFVIACHVLEHSTDVESCLRELQRVARAGYIECPDAFFERINPYKDHRYEVTTREGVLITRRKTNWIRDSEVVELYEHQLKPTRAWHRHLRANPFAFHVRFYWSKDSGGLQFRDVTPNSDRAVPFQSEPAQEQPENAGPALRRALLSGARGLLSQRARNRRLQIDELFRCVTCKQGALTLQGQEYVCTKCAHRYPGRPIPRIFPG